MKIVKGRRWKFWLSLKVSRNEERTEEKMKAIDLKWISRDMKELKIFIFQNPTLTWPRLIKGEVMSFPYIGLGQLGEENWKIWKGVQMKGNIEIITIHIVLSTLERWVII